MCMCSKSASQIQEVAEDDFLKEEEEEEKEEKELSFEAKYVWRKFSTYSEKRKQASHGGFYPQKKSKIHPNPLAIQQDKTT